MCRDVFMFAPFIHQCRDFRTVLETADSWCCKPPPLMMTVPGRHVSLLSPVRPAVKRWVPYFVLWIGCLVTPVSIPQSSTDRTETPYVWVLNVFDEPVSVPLRVLLVQVSWDIKLGEVSQTLCHMWNNNVVSLVGTSLRYQTNTYLIK